MNIDLLIITYNRPTYTAKCLDRLAPSLIDGARLWIWHNGDHEPTLEVVRSFVESHGVHRFHHSPENRMLWAPTNWLLRESTGELVGKLDDDCLVPRDWLTRLVQHHEAMPEAGVLGAWPFRAEDIRLDLVDRKTVGEGHHRVMQNPWVGGAGFLLKRACIERCGPLRENEGFTTYCMRIARAGWVNGWPVPFIMMDHMDDPRSEHTVFRTDDDVVAHRGITAARRGIETVAQFRARAKEAALELQTCSSDWRDYIGWRARAKRALNRLRA